MATREEVTKIRRCRFLHWKEFILDNSLGVSLENFENKKDMILYNNRSAHNTIDAHTVKWSGWPQVPLHSCNPSTLQPEAEGWRVLGQPGLHSENLSQK
jgi:hypothetical protein